MSTVCQFVLTRLPSHVFMDKSFSPSLLSLVPPAEVYICPRRDPLEGCDVNSGHIWSGAQLSVAPLSRTLLILRHPVFGHVVSQLLVSLTEFNSAWREDSRIRGQMDPTTRSFGLHSRVRGQMDPTTRSFGLHSMPAYSPKLVRLLRGSTREDFSHTRPA